MTRLALILALCTAAWGQTPTTIDYPMLRGILAAATAKQPCVVVVTANAMTCASLGAGISLVNNVLTVSATAALPAPAVFFGPSGTSCTTLTTFTLSQPAVSASYFVWRNGVLLAAPGDYSIAAGVLTFTALSPVCPGDIVQVW